MTQCLLRCPVHEESQQNSRGQFPWVHSTDEIAQREQVALEGLFELMNGRRSLECTGTPGQGSLMPQDEIYE